MLVEFLHASSDDFCLELCSIIVKLWAYNYW